MRMVILTPVDTSLRQSEIDLRSSFEMWGTKEQGSEHLKYLKDHPNLCENSMKGYKVKVDSGERYPINMTVSAHITDQLLKNCIYNGTNFY
jgi:hypothetical protein